jgi:hypothetical protein
LVLLNNDLCLGLSSDGNGFYVLQGGILGAMQIDVGCAGKGTFTQSGGQAVILDTLLIGDQSGSTGTYTITGGSIDANNIGVGQVDANNGWNGTGTLKVDSNSACITVHKTLHFGANGTYTVDPNYHPTLIIQPATKGTASVQIAATDPNKVAGLGRTTLVCQFNATDANMSTVNLEVAGKAYDPNLVVGGVDNNFSTANFVIDTLVVGLQGAGPSKCGTTLNLVKNYVNDANAVYVRNLIMAEGAFIKPNGFKLYYLKGGTARRFFPGDANLDGVVDGVDFLAWQSGYGNNTTGTWAIGDFNGDRKVDGVDFLIWQSNYPSGGLSPLGVNSAASPARSLIDLNGDGIISIEEAEKAFDGLPNAK